MNIIKIGNSPMVNSKAVVFKTDQNYTMLLVMFRFNEDDELIYMKWFNYYEKYKREKLDKLIYSDKLFFCIIDDENNKQATFECNNAIRFIIKQCSEETKGKWWSNGEFWGYAKNISSKYAHRAELFNSKF